MLDKEVKVWNLEAETFKLLNSVPPSIRVTNLAQSMHCLGMPTIPKTWSRYSNSRITAQNHDTDEYEIGNELGMKILDCKNNSTKFSFFHLKIIAEGGNEIQF